MATVIQEPFPGMLHGGKECSAKMSYNIRKVTCIGILLHVGQKKNTIYTCPLPSLSLRKVYLVTRDFATVLHSERLGRCTWVMSMVARV